MILSSKQLLAIGITLTIISLIILLLIPSNKIYNINNWNNNDNTKFKKKQNY